MDTPEPLPWPGWDELSPQRQRAIRWHLALAKQRKDENSVLGERVAEVMWKQVHEIDELLSTYATGDERRRTKLLLKEMRESDPDDVHVTQEELKILGWTIMARRDIAKSTEAGDQPAATRALQDLDRRIRQLRAVRSALDKVGLRKATVSLSERSALIGLLAPSSELLQERWVALDRALKARLDRQDLIKLSYFTHYPISVPPPSPRNSRGNDGASAT